MTTPFDAAESHLWTGHHPIKGQEIYTCHAIMAAEKQGSITQEESAIARTMIRNRLEGHKTLEGWLCNEGGVRLGEITDELIQAHRFFWLRHLADEWNQGERK
ncbi:hypothetical protein [Caballeronia sp. TF1N1]|uniref:hypothetical protein n=1 Tax=Caballeronia sp. TF1N1 TaxID=2878153 RepID=UPI001FD318ED|nr:hypothetical protein [Caballeronia sp. TF1N1]